MLACDELYWTSDKYNVNILSTIVAFSDIRFCIIFSCRFIMPLIEEILNDSHSSMEVDSEPLDDVSRKSEKLEIQSEGINLCFIGKPGTETEDKGFISDSLERSSSNGGMHIFGDGLSVERQSFVPVIQEIDSLSQDAADSSKELLANDNAYSPTETDLRMSNSVNVESSDKLAEEEKDSENSLICEFCESLQFSFYSLKLYNCISVCGGMCETGALC